MKDTGIETDFLVHRDGPFHYQAEAESLGARVITCKGAAFPPVYALNLLRILKKYGPYQAIHSHVHHFSGFVMLTAYLAGVPVRLVQSHSDTRYVDAQAGLFRRMYLRLMKRLIWSCATVGTAVSRNAADALFPPDWRNHDKWHVILMGIDPLPFAAPVDGDALRRELNIPADVTVVGHVGRFGIEKNHAFLLRIAAEYLKTAPQTMFLLVGDGPLKDEVERNAKVLGIAGQIRFAGLRSDVPALMRGVMDVLVFPSLFEGLPLVLLEAQAAGLPCLLSDTIAEESDLMPSLLHRESLASSAATWAVRLRELIEMHAGTRLPGCPELVGIDRSVKGLLQCYSAPHVERECGVAS